jgi:hypothetical protein
LLPWSAGAAVPTQPEWSAERRSLPLPTALYNFTDNAIFPPQNLIQKFGRNTLESASRAFSSELRCKWREIKAGKQGSHLCRLLCSLFLLPIPGAEGSDQGRRWESTAQKKCAKSMAKILGKLAEQELTPAAWSSQHQ